MPKVSVIVPIYGVEKYIERCARSLFEQSLEDIEYIFVNDCTQDNSMKILNTVISKYPERKTQIKIVNHEVNQGLPSARKTGIKEATGDYIAHCDSDDWVEKQMYSKLYEKAIGEKVDVVFCDLYVSTDTEDVYKKCTSMELRNANDLLINVLINKALGCVWNKLVKKELYQNEISYPHNNYGEDIALMSQILFYATSAFYLKEPLYHYYYNPSSISRKKDKKHILKSFNDTCTNAHLIDTFFKREDNSLINNAIVCLKCRERDRLIPLIRSRKYYKLWLSQFPEINNKVLFNSYILFKHKIRFILCLIHLFPLKGFVDSEEIIGG